MQWIYNFIAQKLANRLVKILLIAGFNFIGVVSVVGIPIATIVDILLIIVAIQSSYDKCKIIFIELQYRVKENKLIKLLIALIFPSLLLFLIEQPIAAICCLILQFTTIGWIPATIWALYTSSKKFKRLRY